jgi:hypothetical protein
VQGRKINLIQFRIYRAVQIVLLILCAKENECIEKPAPMRTKKHEVRSPAGTLINAQFTMHNAQLIKNLILRIKNWWRE